MQLTRLEVEGIFSFGVGEDRLALDLDDHLTVIVGPNASGKSNVCRVLHLLTSAVRYQDGNQEARSWLWSVLDDHAREARHEGMPIGSRSTVRLTVRLTSPKEVALVTSYMQALVLTAILGTQTADDQSLPALEAWVAAHVTSAAISDLFQGTIVVSHSGVPGAAWSVAYEFQHGDVPLTWHISTTMPNFNHVIAPRDTTAEAGLPSLVTVTQRLLGLNSPPSGPVRPPEAPFTIEALLPAGDEMVRVDMTSTSTNVAPAPHRAFVAAAGISMIPSDPLGPFRRSYGFEAVLYPLLEHAVQYLGADGGSFELTSGSAPTADDAALSMRLFALKNGDQLAQVRYRNIQTLFEALAPGRRFEVRSERREQGESAQEFASKIEVFNTSTEPGSAHARPIRLAGTGVQQALIIAETLVMTPDRVLVLDEPAANLHPPWQRIVRTHLNSMEGQCLLVTHSPYLIPADSPKQLAAIVRFSVRNGATQTSRLTSSDLADNQWVGAMIKELAWSGDARGMLFASGVVLLEGQTELAALPAWFAKSETARQHRGPDDLHIAFYSVGGHLDFRTFVSYLERFSVPWAVICDGAAFRFDIGRHIFEQVLDAGVDDPELAEYVATGISTKTQGDMKPEVFEQMNEVGKHHGIFTLAQGWHGNKDPEGDDESFEAFVNSLPELEETWAAATEVARKSKPRAGRLLAEGTACPAPVDQLYQRVLERLWKQGMAKVGQFQLSPALSTSSE